LKPFFADAGENVVFGNGRESRDDRGKKPGGSRDRIYLEDYRWKESSSDIG
jgi:hypothetical protein